MPPQRAARHMQRQGDVEFAVPGQPAQLVERLVVEQPLKQFSPVARTAAQRTEHRQHAALEMTQTLARFVKGLGIGNGQAIVGKPAAVGPFARGAWQRTANDFGQPFVEVANAGGIESARPWR